MSGDPLAWRAKPKPSLFGRLRAVLWPAPRVHVVVRPMKVYALLAAAHDTGPWELIGVHATPAGAMGLSPAHHWIADEEDDWDRGWTHARLPQRIEERVLLS